MKKIIIFVILLFVFGCANPYEVYEAIKDKYPNSQIIKLQGDGDQYIVYTEKGEIRFINMGRFSMTAEITIEIDQKIDLIVKK